MSNEGVDARLYRLEAEHHGHVEFCKERNQNWSEEIEGVRKHVHDLRNNLQSASTRITETEGKINTMEVKIAGVKEQAFAGTREAIGSAKLWFLITALGGGCGAVSIVLALLQLSHGK